MPRPCILPSFHSPWYRSPPAYQSVPCDAPHTAPLSQQRRRVHTHAASAHLSVDLTVDPLALIAVAARVDRDAPAVHLVVDPLAFEPAAIRIRVDAIPVPLAMLEVALSRRRRASKRGIGVCTCVPTHLIALVVGIDQCTLAVHLALLHGASVQHGDEGRCGAPSRSSLTYVQAHVSG